MRVRSTIRKLACGFAITLIAWAQPPFSSPVVAGKLEAPPRQETSGFAASRRNADVLWTHDDSGGEHALFAITTAGAKIGKLHISGVKNEDWEDIAAYSLDGKSWLLIGDVGDNDAKRSTVFLHVVEEPAIDQLKSGGEIRVKPTRSLEVRYEDGPRDCEAVAVDAAERAIYLLTKREHPPALYRVELDPHDGNAITLARRIGVVTQIPQPTTLEQKIKGYLGRRRGEVTAMDFAPDGLSAVVLTYGDVLLFSRRPNESWAQALARTPVELPPHDLIQAEAACFSADGNKIYVGAEGTRTFLRYDRR